MPGAFTRFRIEALYDRYTIDIPIKNNKLVLVGENGIGKSTVANFVYLFLTHQWQRMLALCDFKAIAAIIDSETIELTKEELLRSRIADKFLKKFSSTAQHRFNAMLRDHPLSELINDREGAIQFAHQYNIPSVVILDYLDSVFEEPQNLSDKLEKMTKSLKSLFTDKVLYLPTYRRIEQDLASIFPELASSSDVARFMERWQRRARSSDYIELVEFGMKDVEGIIAGKMTELDKESRNDLSKLTSTYLRDVILGDYQKTDLSEINELDESTIDAIFNRIDQSVLPKPEQQSLRESINKIKIDPDFRDKDRVVVHFLTKLIDFYKKQQEKEKSVQEFVDVCNQYLTGKKFVYDKINFDISIQLEQLHQGSGNNLDGKANSGKILKMSKLSSGEKQIVSLFSQIYLSGKSNYFVIIDEPELSLSVLWQKRFLPDILNTNRCNGLIAATHSPFIFDNQLDEYAHSLDQFMESLDAEN